MSGRQLIYCLLYTSPSIIDQYKAKNEVLEMEIPQLQEIAVKGGKFGLQLLQLVLLLPHLTRYLL